MAHQAWIANYSLIRKIITVTIVQCLLLSTLVSRLRIEAQDASSVAASSTSVEQRPTPIIYNVPPPPTLPSNLSSVPGLNIKTNDKVAAEFDQHLPFTSGQAVHAWYKIVAILNRPIDYSKLLGVLPDNGSLDIMALLKAGAAQVGAIIGVLVLAIIASIVTFVYIMIHICRRCCCGKQDSAKFEQNPRTMFRLVCSVILLASAAIAFSLAIVINVSANNAVTNMGHMPSVLDGVLSGLSWYISSTFDQFADTTNWALSNSVNKSGAFDLLMSDLNSIGTLVGTPLTATVKAAIGPKLSDLQGATTNIVTLTNKGTALKADYVAVQSTINSIYQAIGYTWDSGASAHKVLANSFSDQLYKFCDIATSPPSSSSMAKCTAGSCPGTYCGSLKLAPGGAGPLTTTPASTPAATDTLFSFLAPLQKVTAGLLDSNGKNKLDSLTDLPKFIQDQTATQVADAQKEMSDVQTDVISTVTSARGNALGQITTMIDQLRSGLASTTTEVASYSKSVNYVGVILMLLCLITPVIGTICAVLGFLFFHSQVPPDKRDGLGNASGKGLAFVKWINLGCTCLLCWLFGVFFVALSVISVVFCSLLSDRAGNFTQLGNVEGKLISLTNLSIPFDLQKTLVGCSYNEALLEVVDLNKMNINSLSEATIRSQLAKFDPVDLKQKISGQIKFDGLSVTIDASDISGTNGIMSTSSKAGDLNAAIIKLPPSATPLKPATPNPPFDTWSDFYKAFNDYPPSNTLDDQNFVKLQSLAKAVDRLQATYASQVATLKTNGNAFNDLKPGTTINDAGNKILANQEDVSDYFTSIPMQNAVASVLGDFILRISAVLQSVGDHLVNQIFHNVGRCRPLFDILMTLVDLFCGGTFVPLTGFSAAMLVVLLFYIPMWITADRLAFLYRRHKVVTF